MKRQFSLWLPTELFEKVKKLGIKEGRSTTQQIIYILKQYLGWGDK